mmetsp:Transcript_10251/g.15599  ORF Transcript_10251/g.15599 Transcript_10251/m.15599 type:complete len:103 (-) Transcript_10251:377-685(-)
MQDRLQPRQAHVQVKQLLKQQGFSRMSRTQQGIISVTSPGFRSHRGSEMFSQPSIASKEIQLKNIEARRDTINKCQKKLDRAVRAKEEQQYRSYVENVQTLN